MQTVPAPGVWQTRCRRLPAAWAPASWQAPSGSVLALSLSLWQSRLSPAARVQLWTQTFAGAVVVIQV